MPHRTLLAAASSVILFVLAFWSYGTYAAGQAREEVVRRQTSGIAEGEDCAVFDEVAALDSVLATVTVSEQRFLDGAEPARDHREWLGNLAPHVATFREAHRCARVGDTLDEPPAKWEEWLAVIDGYASLQSAEERVAIYSDLWRVGHALQRDARHWARGAALVERAARRLSAGLFRANPSTLDEAVSAADALADATPDLHEALDRRTYESELAALDAALAGWFSGFSGMGHAQAVTVFHPVYDAYIALRTRPWAEREGALEAWQREVDGYTHPIYASIQGGRVLELERARARHQATLEAALVAVRVARFRGTYGACPTDLARLTVPEREAPLGALALDGCSVTVADIRVETTATR